MPDTAPTLQSVLDAVLAERGTIRVLDAGCGVRGRVRLPEDSYVVGLDISAEQLAQNTYLDEKVLGDVQTYRFPDGSFDVVVCWELLEHVRTPERALENFRHGLKDDGILVLALPNVLSLKGLVTKYTPLWFHHWFYRHIHKSGARPFQTFMPLSIAPAGIKRYATAHRLSVEYFNIEESYILKDVRTKYGVVGWKWEMVKRAVRGLTLGKVDADLTDFQIILRKQPQAVPSTSSEIGLSRESPATRVGARAS